MDVERLSQRLAALGRLPEGAIKSLGELVHHFDDEAHGLLAFFLVMPFLQPVPLPFVSTPFGLAVALVGARLMVGRPPWLPRRIAARPLTAAEVRRVAEAAERWVRRIEHLVRPRGAFMHEHPIMRRIAGGLICIAGLLLSLPLPVPLSNFLPAFSIALLALGELEEDGLVVALGYVAFTLTCVFFVLLVLVPVLGLDAFGRAAHR